jgi:chemotaxis protein methyltransferase CheR
VRWVINREDSIHLPEDVFRLLRDLISDHCGIYFDDESRHLLERRLNRRIVKHGFDNYRDYYRFLLFGEEKEKEIAEVIDVLTVNETYFFRENKQFKAFSEEICREIRQHNQEKRKLRIWSAGCASGEEPYTIAMLVLELQAAFKGWEIEIIGSDINERVIRTARAGFYRKNSFRVMNDYFLRRYFTKDGEGYLLRDEVRRLVNFSCLNILDHTRTSLVGAMDIIFCRNVLIYFNPIAKKTAIETFYHHLRDGGYLLLGHAESLMNVSTSFALKHLKNDMVYQKPKKSIIAMSNESLFRMIWGK